MGLIFELFGTSLTIFPFQSEIELTRNILVKLLSDPAVFEIRENNCYNFEEYFSQVDVTFALFFKPSMLNLHGYCLSSTL